MIVKACACGDTYSQSEWDELRQLPDEVYEGVLYEFRLCRCGSTLCLAPSSRTREQPDS